MTAASIIDGSVVDASAVGAAIPAELPVCLAGVEYPGRTPLTFVAVAMGAAVLILTSAIVLVTMVTPQAVIPGAAAAGVSRSYQVDEAYALAMGRHVFDQLHTWNARTIDQRFGRLIALCDPAGARLLRSSMKQRRSSAVALDLAQVGTMRAIAAQPITPTTWQVTWEADVETYYGTAKGETVHLTESAIFVAALPTPQRETFLTCASLALVSSTGDVQ